MKRPSKSAFKPSAHLTPNVTGTVTRYSLSGKAYCVTYTDGDEKNDKWMTVSDPCFMSGQAGGIVATLDADRSPPWSDVKDLIKDFDNELEDRWSNTRGMLQPLVKRRLSKDETNLALAWLASSGCPEIG